MSAKKRPAVATNVFVEVGHLSPGWKGIAVPQEKQRCIDGTSCPDRILARCFRLVTLVKLNVVD